MEPVSPVILVQQRTTVPCPVRVRNLGHTIWSSNGRNPVHLTLRWLTPRKDAVDVPPARFRLPAPVYPGQSVVVPATVTAPDFLGHYLIEADLTQDGGAAFATHGSRPALVEAQVTGRDADDIDYHKAYATADLTRDYWTVVGPSTKEEFDRLGQAKLDMLRRAGLTPDGRVLDVGCGTGQLAVPLETFLTDRGCYYGTDIGPEAIAYCLQQFKRPNFRFAKNEMTSLPIAGMEFDFVTFFSVFTHTFPDETVLLLAEAKRLLAPGGVVIGDVFTSPMVERAAGNRGAMELNRDHFLKLVALAGLRAEVKESWPWQKYGRREVYSFTRDAGAAG
ncbi:Methyltransferase [Fimbriiglobus ruber]|uniref:Methyltransferase n=1 Tax=Fimbriiglobus ruber TaxID=1908690 RepID=A0A225D9V8_9BACT|nr:Methyltransferase [Fimbriiglobus ruber]